MKLSKILILFILIVLPVNANTIYNLIKIPNLKIYKNNSFNNLKYLTAKKPFQVGIRNDNVTCFNASINDINQRLSGRVVTKMSLLKNYCPAEEYHQKYLEKK